MPGFPKMNKRVILDVIVVILTVLLTLFTRQLLDIEEARRKDEQLRLPKLTYSSRLALSSIDGDLINAAGSELYERYMEQTIQYKNKNPSNTFMEAGNAILPITTTLPARAFGAQILIKNAGLTTLTNVLATVIADQPIKECSVISSERPKGSCGVEQPPAEIKMQRIFAGETITISFVFGSYSDYSPRRDQVFLTSRQGAIRLGYTPNSDFRSDEISSKESKPLFLPSPSDIIIGYVPSQRPSISISVKSQEAEGSELPTPTPTN